MDRTSAPPDRTTPTSRPVSADRSSLLILYPRAPSLPHARAILVRHVRSKSWTPRRTTAVHDEHLQHFARQGGQPREAALRVATSTLDGPPARDHTTYRRPRVALTKRTSVVSRPLPTLGLGRVACMASRPLAERVHRPRAPRRDVKPRALAGAALAPPLHGPPVRRAFALRASRALARPWTPPHGDDELHLAAIELNLTGGQSGTTRSIERTTCTGTSETRSDRAGRGATSAGLALPPTARRVGRATRDRGLRRVPSDTNLQVFACPPRLHAAPAWRARRRAHHQPRRRHALSRVDDRRLLRTRCASRARLVVQRPPAASRGDAAAGSPSSCGCQSYDSCISSPAHLDRHWSRLRSRGRGLAVGPHVPRGGAERGLTLGARTSRWWPGGGADRTTLADEFDGVSRAAPSHRRPPRGHLEGPRPVCGPDGEDRSEAG